MKTNKNLARILIMFLLLSIITMPLVQAVGEIDTSFYNPNNEVNDTNTILQIGGKLWGALSTVGVVVSVISLAIIGLRSVFGSIEDKAAYKKAMMPYIVGLCLVAGISIVVNVVYDFANDVEKGYSAFNQGDSCPNCGQPMYREEIRDGCSCGYGKV